MTLTLSEYLVQLLEAYEVDTEFGIPGVHTVEFYRGSANSPIPISLYATNKSLASWLMGMHV